MRLVAAGAVALLVAGAALGAQDEPIAVRPWHVRPQVDSVADSMAVWSVLSCNSDGARGQRSRR